MTNYNATPLTHLHRMLARAAWLGRSAWRLGASIAFVAGCAAAPSSAVPTDDAGTSSGGPIDASSSTTADAEAGWTYHADARPILERQCTRCHSDAGIAFALTDYDAVAGYREAIAVAVDEGTMPPWQMASDCNAFEGDFSLSDEDRQVLTEWIDRGAPEGSEADYVAPEPLALASLSRTDRTLTLPEPYRPTLVPDDYHCFVMDWPDDEAQFLTGVEIAPDNTAVVHHLLLYLAEPEWTDAFEALDAGEAGPGYTCFGGPGGGTLPGYSGPVLAVWAPGNQVGDFPEGTGIRIAPGSKLVVQVHYNTLADNGLPDQSAVHLKTDAQVEREAHIIPWVAPKWRLPNGMPIPAGQSDVEHEFVMSVAEGTALLAPQVPEGADLEIHMATHHMHGLGTRGQLEVQSASGEAQCVADLPNYDFGWQLMYRLAQPIVVTPEDKLAIRCAFDNSAGSEDVHWGDGTAEEMCLGFFYAVPR